MGGAFVGVGWGIDRNPEQTGGIAYFDLKVPEGTRQIARAEYEVSVRQGIFIVLNTAKGERVMRPDFGCGIHELVFAVNDSTTRGLAEHEVREALTRWEPRIDLQRVKVSATGSEGEVLLISIDYRVRATDSRFNLVYPFYLQRGSL